MLSLRASSSSSNARSRRRRGRCAAMSPMALSPAALLLLRGVSGSNATTNNDATTVDWVAFAAQMEKMKGGTSAAAAVPRGDASLTQHSIQFTMDVTSTLSPVASPTMRPSKVPTRLPTPLPTTANPTNLPTPLSTTASPTSSPITNSPTFAPSTAEPTPFPTTASPTQFPTTAQPTTLPMTAIATPTPLPTRALPAPLITTPTPKPTQKKTRFVRNPPLSKLGECEGDCDNDDECGTGLVCYQRDKNEAVPGCDGGENDGSETDYCTYVGGTPPGTASPTLSPTTASPTTASPTLQPTISSAPTVSAAPSNPPSLEPTQSPTVGASAPVRLRLYWQADYHWQDTRREMFWCMQCRSGACENGSTIEVDNCGSSSRQKFQYYTGDQSYRPMDNPNLCFTENGWDAEANPIKLKPCNGSSKQRWVGFDANKRPFEIFAGRNQRYLLTQAHHPKAHERVFPQQSRRARNHKTSKWIVY